MRDITADICKNLFIEGEFKNAEPHGNGHIHDTFLVSFNASGRINKFILQKINRSVFKNPAELMENIAGITSHLQIKNTGKADKERKSLKLIYCRDGRPFALDGDGNYWRAFNCIEGIKSIDIAETPGQAFEAAHAFGEFLKNLSDYSGPGLHETIPDFHNPTKRFEGFIKAVEEDKFNRAKYCEGEIDYIINNEPMLKTLQDRLRNGEIPVHLVHNDTKVNNILYDYATGKAICVIDLDTVMPGLALHDFGDLMRTCLSPADEDERDLSRIDIRTDFFQALALGYLSGSADILTDAEINLLPLSGIVMTLESALRFLADYLSGDIYFKVHRIDHNMERARAQIALAEAMGRKIDEMRSFVEIIISRRK